MRKGISQFKRDSRWHKRHGKRLRKNKRRQKGAEFRRIAWKTKTQMSKAEAQFRAAQEREKQKKASRWEVYRHRLFLRLISLKFIVWVRKIIYWWGESRYKG